MWFLGGENAGRGCGRVEGDAVEARRLSLVVVVIALEVGHGAFVAAAESFAIGIALIAWDVGMTKGVMIVGIGVAMMIGVVMRGFNAVVEALALYIAKLIRGGVPSAVLCPCGG